MKYLNYEGIGLMDAEAMKYCGHSLNPDYEIFPGIYLQPCNLGDLTRAIDLEELGPFDFAVPQSWSEENNYPRGLDQAVWLYRREFKGRLSVFGEPFTVRQMLDRLRDRIRDAAVECWLEQEATE